MMKWYERLFGKRESAEEKRINAEMAYRASERNFRRYDMELDASIAKFKRMACEAADAGQMANALTAGRFVKKMKIIKEKVASVRQHFEMLHSLNSIGDIMVEFMDSCKKMGCDLKENINISGLNEGRVDMETGLNKLAYITECVEQAFKDIEEALDIVPLAEGSAEDEEALREILMERGEAMGKTNTEPVPKVWSADVSAGRVENGKPMTVIRSDPADGEMNELRRRLESL